MTVRRNRANTTKPDPKRNRTSVLAPAADDPTEVEETSDDGSGIELEDNDEDDQEFEPLPPAVVPRTAKNGLSPKNRYQARRMVKTMVKTTVNGEVKEEPKIHFAGEIFELTDKAMAAEFIRKGSIRAA